MATRPVVVGVDGSEESLRAAQWAAMEAVRHEAPLRIVSALGSVSRYSAMHAPCPVVVVREETTAVIREVAVGIRDRSGD